MKQDLIEEIEIPQGVTLTVDKGIFTAKGKAGELSRKIHNPKINHEVKDGKVILKADNATKTEKKIIKTFSKHIQNLLTGANEKFVYKLKICSGHFPMSATVKGDKFEIKNFIGEAKPRQKPIPKGVDVKVNGEIIVIESSDKELAGQTATLIESMTRRSGFDKRIFQDGIYLIEKNGKEIKL
jgi:large subunit ribosomal protein L6